MSGYLEIKDVEAPEYNPNPKNDVYKPYGSVGSDIPLVLGILVGIICIVCSIWASYSKILFVLCWISGLLAILKFGGLIYCKYIYRKKFIKNGQSYPAIIINAFDYVRSVSNGGTAINQVEYAIEVRYEDKTVELKGNEVDARKYLENPYCTVYEWNGKVIAADFKVRDEYISADGKSYSLKPVKKK